MYAAALGHGIVTVYEARDKVNRTLRPENLLAHTEVFVRDDRLEGHVHAVGICEDGAHRVIHVALILLGPMYQMPRSHNLLGEHPQRPRTVLQLMACQFGHQAARILAVKTPVYAPFQLRRGNITTPVVITIPVVAYAHNLAYTPFVYHAHGLDVLRVEEALLTDEEHRPELLATVVHTQTILLRIGHGLLAEDPFACLHGIERHRRMQIQRRGYDHTVYIPVLEQLPIVAV